MADQLWKSDLAAALALIRTSIPQLGYQENSQPVRWTQGGNLRLNRTPHPTQREQFWNVGSVRVSCDEHSNRCCRWHPATDSPLLRLKTLGGVSQWNYHIRPCAAAPVEPIKAALSLLLFCKIEGGGKQANKKKNVNLILAGLHTHPFFGRQSENTFACKATTQSPVESARHSCFPSLCRAASVTHRNAF